MRSTIEAAVAGGRPNLETLPIPTLILGIQNGIFPERLLEELLWYRLQSQLVQWFSSFGAKQDAEDLAQGFICRMLGRVAKNGELFGNYDSTLDFRPFVYVAARNYYLSALRRRRPDLVADGLERPGGDLTADDVALRETEQRVRAAVEELPKHYREVLKLTFEGQDRHEIAESIGHPLERVDRLLNRSRELLAAKLGYRRARRSRSSPTTPPAARPPEK